MAITWDQYHPEGTATQFEKISVRGRSTLGFIANTETFSVIPAGGERLTAITAGVFQAGWDGYIAVFDSNKEMVINITQWPDALNGKRCVFSVGAQENPA